METKTFMELAQMTEDEARSWLESIRWPDGPSCPHCGSTETPYKLEGKSHRPGLYKCREKVCRRQFTVTVGTIFHRSRLGLKKWVLAFHIVCASKKGVSALQLQRQLKLGSYQTAWHMAHRIRHAMAHQPLSDLLKGTVEMDETYVGGKPRKANRASNRKPRKRGRGTDKAPVMALVERGGPIVVKHVARPTRREAHSLLGKHADPRARLTTDEAGIYTHLGRRWPGGHDVIRHYMEYVRGDVHTNTVEGFFGLLKRGIQGAFHHVSKEHLQRYVDEFAFRWNARKLTDEERTLRALKQGDGVRLTYRPAKA